MTGQFCKRIALRAIVAYQALQGGRPSPCRFSPSCSCYAHDAISTYGALKGLGLTLGRLSRCRPLGGHGWDPVPPAPNTVERIG